METLYLKRNNNNAIILSGFEKHNQKSNQIYVKSFHFFHLFLQSYSFVKSLICIVSLLLFFLLFFFNFVYFFLYYCIYDDDDNFLLKEIVYKSLYYDKYKFFFDYNLFHLKIHSKLYLKLLIVYIYSYIYLQKKSKK